MKALCVTSSEFDLISCNLADAVRRSDDDFFSYDGAAAYDVVAIIRMKHCSLPWPVAELREFSTDDARINTLEGFIALILWPRNSITWPSEALQPVPYLFF